MEGGLVAAATAPVARTRPAPSFLRGSSSLRSLPRMPRPSHFGEIPWRQSRARHPAGRAPPPCAPAGTPLRGADGSRRKRPALTVRRAWPLPLGLGPELSTQATQLVGGTRGWPRRRLGPRVLETPRQPTVSAGASSRPQHHTRQQSQTTSPARPASPLDCAAAGARRWHQARRRAGN